MQWSEVRVQTSHPSCGPCLEKVHLSLPAFPASSASSLRAFRHLPPELGFGFAIAPIKGYPSFLLFSGFGMESERRRRVPRGWGRKVSGRLCTRSRRKCPVRTCTPTTFWDVLGASESLVTSRKQIDAVHVFPKSPFDKLQFGTQVL